MLGLVSQIEARIGARYWPIWKMRVVSDKPPNPTPSMLQWTPPPSKLAAACSTVVRNMSSGVSPPWPLT